MSDPTTGVTGVGESPRPAGSAASGAALDAPAVTRRSEAPPKPKIGDTRPAPPVRVAAAAPNGVVPEGPAKPRRRRRGGRGRGGRSRAAPKPGAEAVADPGGPPAPSRPARAGGRQPTRAARPATPAERRPAGEPDEADEAGRASPGRRRGRERKGRPVGRYLMCVHVAPDVTQIALLEGRTLVEHYIARGLRRRHPDRRQHLPRAGSRTCCRAWRRRSSTSARPKNAVLYHGRRPDDTDDVESRKGRGHPDRAAAQARPDDHLPGHEEPDRREGRPAHPGGLAPGPVRRARAGVERVRASPSVSTTASASACAASSTRIRPEGHGLIVRTAAEGASAEELRRDIAAARREVGRDRRRGAPQGSGAGAAAPRAGTSPCG